jgi:hypothetical protein
MENSIARHGETLVELKLFLCPMVTSTEATLRPRMFQTMGPGLGPPQIRAQRRANLANEIDLAVASGTALPTPSCVWFRILRRARSRTTRPKLCLPQWVGHRSNVQSRPS